MPFDRTQPYATASGAGGQWYIQGGQAYSLNGVAIDPPVVPATRNQTTGPFIGLSDVPNRMALSLLQVVKVEALRHLQI